MTRKDEPQRDPSPEEEGIPDLDDSLDRKDITEEGIMPPRDRPVAAGDHGTTRTEQRMGETGDERHRRRTPDVHERDSDAHEPEHKPVGRLREDHEGLTDDEKTLVSDETGDREALSAEEDAVRERAE